MSDRIMKILFVIPSMTQGGAEKNMIWLANNLSDNYKILFVTLTKKKNLQSDSLKKSIAFYQLNKNKSFKSILKLRKIINTEKPDILISSIINANFASVFSTLLLKRNKPVNILRLSNDLEFIGSSSLKNKLMLSISIFLGKKLVVLSDQNYRTAANKFSFAKDKIVKIENPVIVYKNLQTELKNNNIFSITRIESHKNIDFLIENLKILSKNYKFKLSIYGEGTLLDQYKNIYSNQEFVEFNGFKDRKNINEKEYGIFINCSEYEGSPNSTIEAITSGKICLIPNNLITTLPRSLQKNVYSYKKGDDKDFQKKLKLIFNIKETINQNVKSTENKIVGQWKDLVENC